MNNLELMHSATVLYYKVYLLIDIPIVREG